MSWGVDGPVAIPDGTTWVGSVDGRTWETSGSDLEWSGFNYEFRVFSSLWSGSAWGSYTEVTSSIGLFSFNTNRGVNDWWLSAKTGSATLSIDFPVDDFATLDQYFYLARKIRIAVDTPAGLSDLFVGMVSSRTKSYDSRGYPILNVQLMDHFGWCAQSTTPALTRGAQLSGYMVSWLLQSYGAAITSAVVAGINTAVGLSVQGTQPAGNLLDLINTYVRGGLEMLWVDGSGVFQHRLRDWWYPFPDPVATIGSLDRGSGGDRDDPTDGDTGFKFPATATIWQSPIEHTEITWNHPAASPFTSYTASVGAGTAQGYRRWNDTVQLTNYGDVTAHVAYLLNAFGGEPYDKMVTVRIPADYSTQSMDYCARADVTDFVEVAKETQLHLDRREWRHGFVMGVRHSWNPAGGWSCELDVTLELTDTEVDA